MPMFRGIGGGIGLAVEAYQHHKNKKEGRSGEQGSVSQSRSIEHESQSNPFNDRKNEYPQDRKDGFVSEDSDIEDDEETWALDEASRELMPLPPAYSEVDPQTDVGVEEQVQKEKNPAVAFLNKHPLTSMRTMRSEIPVPVIIPQRRPREAQRGFVLAYPPLLDTCAGIDQDTFFDFLMKLNESCLGSQAFDVVNLATFAVGFVPSIAAQIVQMAANKATAIAQEGYSRGQRNTFLDRINEGYFQPRGLWAMVVTWQPEVQQTFIRRLPLRSSLSSGGYPITPQPGQSHTVTNILSSSSGTTRGDIPLTDCAALVYPPIDQFATTTQQIPLAKQSKLQSSQDFIANYIDRRRAAEFAGLHANSAVANQSHTWSSFSSRWADPNHPANSGTLLGLVTGGRFDPVAQRRGILAQRRAQFWGGQNLTDEQVRLAQMGRLDRFGNVREQPGLRGLVDRATAGRMRGGPIGSVKRMIQQDVCYLMIVNYPDGQVGR